jgi:hypothetical protein
MMSLPQVINVGTDMSKVFLVLMLALNAAIYDPSKLVYALGSELGSFGWQLSSALKIEKIFPSLFRRHD